MSDNREGIEQLRETIDEVAREIESRPATAGVRRPLLPWALTAAAAALALLAWLTWFHPGNPPEVEVLVLKVRGRPVQARVVETNAPATILIVPRRENAPAPVAAAVVIGGTP